MPFNFPVYGKKGEKTKRKEKETSNEIAVRSFVAEDSTRSGEEKSSSFDTDAVVLLPLFMKCLFSFFTELFNEKLLVSNFSSVLFRRKAERAERKTCQK